MYRHFSHVRIGKEDRKIQIVDLRKQTSIPYWEECLAELLEGKGIERGLAFPFEDTFCFEFAANLLQRKL